MQRQHRLRGPALDQDEYADQDNTGGPEDVDGRRAPAVGRAAQAGEQDEGRRGQREHGRAEIVDDVVHPAEVTGHLSGDHGERHDADGHVDVEDPAPGQVVDEHPAEQRPDDAREAEHRAEQAHVTAALARRDDVAHDGLRADHQAARAQALDRAERDQLEHRLAEAGQDRADQEDHDRGLEEDLPAVLVAELAPQRRGYGRGEQVSGDDPSDVRAALEVADDGRQRGRDDGLIERRQQHPEHERTDDQEHPAVAQAWQCSIAQRRSVVQRRGCGHQRQSFRRPGERGRPISSGSAPARTLTKLVRSLSGHRSAVVLALRITGLGHARRQGDVEPG